MTAYTFPTVPGSYVVGDTVQFNYTGASQTFLTSNIVTMKIEIWGAKGAEGVSPSVGGNGGYTYGTYSTTNGTTLYVVCGQLGAARAGSNLTPTGSAPTTFNGGGLGAYSTNVGTTLARWGGGGGGATDIRLGGTALANRILVAGGGGAGGHRNVQLSGAAHGGAGGGGGFNTKDGNPGYTASARTPGIGGTSSAGGAGGIFYYDIGQTTGSNASAGTLGTGGTGGGPGLGTARFDYADSGGGGGGGGYYGGGGAPSGGFDGRGGAGAGGGSGFIDTTYFTFYGGESGINNSNGYAIITVLS
jgi:hypothetical protein